MQRTKVRQTGKTYIGVDNGVTGSIGIIPFHGVGAQFHHTPVFRCLNYQKVAKYLNRVDVVEVHSILKDVVNPFVILERPMVNPSMFNSTLSACRALEATLCALDRLFIPYMFVDSKEWQRDMLPEGVKGSDNLKAASSDVGCRLFPQFRDMFKADADGMLIAEWARRKML